MSKVIIELQKWVTGNSLLVVTVAGLLTRLYCPFRVVALVSYKDLQMGCKYVVERVAVGPKLELVYIINGRPYSYHYFRIGK